MTGYRLYRATTTFDATADTLRINTQTIAGTCQDDQISDDGTYYYRMAAVNALSTERAPYLRSLRQTD